MFVACNSKNIIYNWHTPKKNANPQNFLTHLLARNLTIMKSWVLYVENMNICVRQKWQ